MGSEASSGPEGGLPPPTLTPEATGPRDLATGQNGPYAQFRASDIEIMALSGAMALAGEEDGAPMRVTAPQAAWWVGVEAVMGALTALEWRSKTGRGQHVDVSAQVAVLLPTWPSSSCQAKPTEASFENSRRLPTRRYDPPGDEKLGGEPARLG